VPTYRGYLHIPTWTKVVTLEDNTTTDQHNKTHENKVEVDARDGQREKKRGERVQEKVEPEDEIRLVPLVQTGKGIAPVVAEATVEVQAQTNNKTNT
jgi:hypothetical protein